MKNKFVGLDIAYSSFASFLHMLFLILNGISYVGLLMLKSNINKLKPKSDDTKKKKKQSIREEIKKFLTV